MPIDPPTQAFLDTLSGPPIDTLSPAEARAVLTRLQAGVIPRPPADVVDPVLPVGPTGRVRVRVVRPLGEGGPYPAIVYLHGGGWVLGDLDTHDLLARSLADHAGAVVFLVDYDRAPEARFPVATEQAWAVARHVVDEAARFDIDPERLAIAGDSAGGTLAIGAALLAAERGGPAFAFQVLFYPVTDAGMATPSYAEFADGPWLTRAAMRWFWDAWVPDESQRALPTVSPLQAPPAQLATLPPTFLATAENDVLRDEGEAFADRLAHAGVRVTSVRYNGTVHDFVMLHGLRDTPAARGAIAQAGLALHTVFAAPHPARHPVREPAPA